MKVFRRKRLNLFLLALLAAAAGTSAASAQGVRVPRPSPKASVMQTVGTTDVTITYSRPGVKGRRIWGDPPAGAPATAATLDDSRSRPKDAPIVAYGRVWRTGANEATLFEVTDDVLVNGQKLPAGRYSLHTIPARDEWTIIFNKDPGQWGSFRYDEKQDILRVKAKPQPAEMQEWLSFEFPDVTENTARVVLRWEKVAVPFTVEVPDVKAVTLAKARAAVAAAKPDDWSTPLQAANYAFQNNGDPAEAWRWLEQSIKVKETFQNVYTKARALAAQGKTQEAIAAGERALVLGKEAKANTADLEKRLADWKAGKN